MATGRQNYLTKQTGEYLVAAELSRRGLIATTFTGNVPHYDIIASNEHGKHVSVQVKASRGSSWQFGDEKSGRGGAQPSHGGHLQGRFSSFSTFSRNVFSVPKSDWVILSAFLSSSVVAVRLSGRNKKGIHSTTNASRWACVRVPQATLRTRARTAFWTSTITALNR